MTRSQDKVTSVFGTQVTPSECECGHAGTAHRSIPPYRCQWYFTGGKCKCVAFTEYRDTEPSFEEITQDAIRDGR